MARSVLINSLLQSRVQCGFPLFVDSQQQGSHRYGDRIPASIKSMRGDSFGSLSLTPIHYSSSPLRLPLLFGGQRSPGADRSADWSENAGCCPANRERHRTIIASPTKLNDAWGGFSLSSFTFHPRSSSQTHYFQVVLAHGSTNHLYDTHTPHFHLWNCFFGIHVHARIYNLLSGAGVKCFFWDGCILRWTRRMRNRRCSTNSPPPWVWMTW